jgi:predicted nucleotidyltransferase
MRTLEKLPLTTAERAAVEAAARLLRARFPVEQVMLFGSRARGQGDPESDLDLLVLTTRAMGWREREALVDALFELELAYEVVLSPLVVARDAWEKGPYRVLPLHAEVVRDGIVL